MEIETANQIFEVVNVAEAARRLSACDKTLARRITDAGIAPDAYLVLGSTGKRSPLFVASRLNELRKLVSK